MAHVGGGVVVAAAPKVVVIGCYSSILAFFLTQHHHGDPSLHCSCISFRLSTTTTFGPPGMMAGFMEAKKMKHEMRIIMNN